TPAIVCLVENGQPKPSTCPQVHPGHDAASTEAARLANAYPGKEFAVYEYKRSAKVEVVRHTYDHEWQRLAAKGEKIAAIKELRSITGLGLVATKNAVEHWLDNDEQRSRTG